MKTTLELSEQFLKRAKRHARRAGTSLRALVEEGLRLAMKEVPPGPRYVLPDCSVGDPHAENPRR